MLKVRKSWTKHMKLLVQVVFFIVIVLGNAIAASATVYDFLISKYYHLKVKKFTIFAVSLFP